MKHLSLMDSVQSVSNAYNSSREVHSDSDWRSSDNILKGYVWCELYIYYTAVHYEILSSLQPSKSVGLCSKHQPLRSPNTRDLLFAHLVPPEDQLLMSELSGQARDLTVRLIHLEVGFHVSGRRTDRCHGIVVCNATRRPTAFFNPFSGQGRVLCEELEGKWVLMSPGSQMAVDGMWGTLEGWYPHLEPPKRTQI